MSIRHNTTGPGLWYCTHCGAREDGRQDRPRCPRCDSKMAPIIYLYRATKFRVTEYRGDSDWVTLANKALCAHQECLRRKREPEEP